MNFLSKANLLLLVAVVYTKYAICYNKNHGIIHDVGKLHWQRRNSDTYLQFHPRTLIECAIACLLRSGRCKSINYSRQMLFCELNYNNNLPNNKTKSFQYSDITTWSKNLTGKCQDVTCLENEVCSMETGNCSISDCGSVNFGIPENSVLQNYGHHEVGNAVDFVCRDRFVMYNKHTGDHEYDSTVMCDASGHWGSLKFVCLACNTYSLRVDEMAELVNSDFSWEAQTYVFRCKAGYRIVDKDMSYFNPETVTVTCDQDTGNWEGADFFCKKPEIMLEDFCQQGYTFNEISNICYKYHSKKCTREAAMDVCEQEHAHLLVINNGTVMDFFKSLPDNEIVYVDGILYSGSNWTGWADEILTAEILHNGSYQGNETNSTCLSVKNATIQLTACDVRAHFICQFELCPQSVGYRYDIEKDICYKHFPARQYINEMCTASQVPRFLGIYKPIPLQRDKVKDIYNGQEDRDFKFPTAYFLGDSTSYWNATHQCHDSRVLAKVDTEQIQDTVIRIINNRTKSFRIGALLSNKETYNYRFSDDSLCTFLPDDSLLDTDKQRCIRINNETHYSTFHCSHISRFICKNDGQDEYELSYHEWTLAEAIQRCEHLGHSLLKIKTDTDKNSVKEFLKEQNLSKTDKFLIDMELESKNTYNYKWLLDGTYFTDNFGQTYSNMIKDSQRSVMFDITSRKFELLSTSDYMPYLCQTKLGAIWEGFDEDEWAANAIENYYWITVQVDKRNTLPYVCEIDTNEIIYRLNLYHRRQFKPRK